MAILSYNPPVLDLVVYAGDDTYIPMTISSGGDPVNITGTHSSQIRLTRDGELLGTIQVVIPEPTNGEATLVISSETADALVVDAVENTDYFGNELITAPMFQGVWDWNYSVGNVNRTMVQGKITVIKDVTR
jgi:hypothetical protein